MKGPTRSDPEKAVKVPRDRSHFSLTAAEYEVARSGHLERRRHQLVRRAIEGQATSLRKVLEIGFGSGKLLAELAALFPWVRFTGLEMETKMVEYASRRYQAPNLRYQLADITAWAGDERFEFAYSIDVLHHIHDLDLFCASLRGLLRDRGVWLAIEPNVFHPFIWYSQERMRRSGLDEITSAPGSPSP